MEVLESQDGQFSGRIHCEKDAIRKRQLRLHLSSLRTEDSGCYVCKLSIGHCIGSDRCTLNVTEPNLSVPHPTTVNPPTENQGRTHLPLLGILVIIILTICCITCKIPPKNRVSLHAPSETHPLCSLQTVSK